MDVIFNNLRVIPIWQMGAVHVGIPVTPEGLIIAVGEKFGMTVRFSPMRRTVRNVVISFCMILVVTTFLSGIFFGTIAAVIGNSIL